MADDPNDAVPLTGELVTANYGWIKPTVGDSDDAWGGYINTDLDGIDTTVKSVSNVANAAYPASNPSGYQTAAQVTGALPVASSTAPAMDGTAAAGVGTTYARADHVHPTDTSRASVASVPVASTTTPVMDGTAAIGTGTTWAKADHVHPSDTSRLPLTGGTLSGALTPSTTAGLVGTTAGDNANAGSVGEVIANNQTTAQSLASATATNIAAISLTPGDWDVCGEVWFLPAGATPTQAQAAINSISATIPTSTNLATARTQQSATFAPSAGINLPLRTCRVNLTTTTTYYLIVFLVFSGGSVTATGNIWARRAR